MAKVFPIGPTQLSALLGVLCGSACFFGSFETFNKQLIDAIPFSLFVDDLEQSKKKRLAPENAE